MTGKTRSVFSRIRRQPREACDRAVAFLSRQAAPVYDHGAGGLAHFMRPLDIIEPGIVPANQWRAPMFAPGRRRTHACRFEAAQRT